MVFGGPMVIGEIGGDAPPLSGRYRTRAFVRQEGLYRTPGSALDGGGGADRENENNAAADGVGVPPKEKGIPKVRIATINIQAGYGAAAWNLQAVAEDAEQMKLDIVFVQETKIRGEKHANRAGNFDIIASESSTNNQGGVAIFVRRGTADEHSGWSGEDAKIYDTNVVAMTFVSGNFRRRMIGVYLSPREINGDTWNGLQRACAEAKDPIWILGDFNADLHSLNSARMDLAQNQDTSVRTAEIKAFIATWGCENFAHTKIQRRSTGVWTWRHRRTINGEKISIKSVCDYITGPKNDPVTAFRTRRCTNIRTDHRMIYVDLKIRPNEHKHYLRGRKKFPATVGPDGPIDHEYNEIIRLQETQQDAVKNVRPGWISEETWKLIKIRNLMTFSNADNESTRRRNKRQLKRHIRRLLTRDRMERLDREARDIEKAMEEQPDGKVGFQILQKWYKRRSGVKLPMSHQALADVSREWTGLYAQQDLVKPMFSTEVITAMRFKVYDGPLTDAELRACGKRLKKGKAPGPSKFRGDTIRRWAWAEPTTDDADCWDKLSRLCQKIFLTGHVPKRMKEGILVLLPKNGQKGEFRGITLLDTVYKLISMCVNERAKAGINWHAGIHGFRSQRGCQTALVEAKADMTAREDAGRTYHQIFLDLSKAFDTVDRERLFSLMRAYGFGEKAERFFRECWKDSFVAPRAAGIYGPRVPVKAGVRQGDVISPLLFNIVVDAILRMCDNEKPELLERVQKIFYADDGRLGGEDAEEVQEVLDYVADLFERIGLNVNTKKTVSMTNRLRFRNLNIAFSAKLRAQLHEPVYRERWKAFTECEVCGKVVQNRNMRRHCLHCHPELPTTHRHPNLWTPSPAPGPPPAENAFTVFWDRCADTGTSLHMSCPHDTCLSTRFASPAMLYRHWSVAGHEEQLKIVDRRGEGAVDVSFRYQCPKCKLMMRNPVPQSHASTKACKDNTARRKAKIRRSRNELELRRSPFKAKGDRLPKVDNFLYLGRILEAANDDTIAVKVAIAKAKRKWAEVRRVLAREPVKIKTFVRFYKAIILNVLLYGSETWKVSRQALDSLESFHRKCVRTISGQQIRREVVDGEVHWIRPPIGPLYSKTKLKPLTDYIETRKKNLEENYKTRSTADRCDVPATSYTFKRKLFL